MIRLITCLGVLFCIPTLFAQSRPIPPGIRQADQADVQSQRDMPPPLNQRATIDPTQAAGTMPMNSLPWRNQSHPRSTRLRKGVLPKDLSEKLKRIEKLAKQLRSQLSP